MNARRVMVASGVRVVDRQDPYEVLPSDGLRGSLPDQPGEVVVVTLDGGREVLVKRSDLTVEES